MIAVIADDFTGAAELGGISLRYGLKVELCVGEVEYGNADVLIVSTDSRSLNKNQAIAVTEKAVKQILQLKPKWIYKKIDSVLRGYVLDEARVQMQLMNKSKAFIMPANPSLGRTIKNGQYFVNGIKINEAGFEHDPEFPITASSVREILNNEVEVLKAGDKATKGIIVGGAEMVGDYELWVDEADSETVLVGAGDFFTALLNQAYEIKQEHGFEMLKPHLYVSGTAFKERKAQIKNSDCVSYLPDLPGDEWLTKTGDIIRKFQKAIIAIDGSPAAPAALRMTMATAVKELAERESIKEIFIEGGSTAAAVLQEMSIKRLEPINELERGVVRMKANDVFITAKPGSYGLPEQIKELYSLK